MELRSLLLGEAHTSNSTPCEIGVLMLLSFVEDSRVIIKVAPGLSRSDTRSASSRFRSLGIAEFPAGCWPPLRFWRLCRLLLLQEPLGLASTDADSRDSAIRSTSPSRTGSTCCKNRRMNSSALTVANFT